MLISGHQTTLEIPLVNPWDCKKYKTGTETAQVLKHQPPIYIKWPLKLQTAPMVQWFRARKEVQVPLNKLRRFLFGKN